MEVSIRDRAVKAFERTNQEYAKGIMSSIKGSAGERRHVTVNGRSYTLPKRPVVIVCVDGCDPEYIHRGFDEGIIPNIQRFFSNGFGTFCKAVVPTFTNPNNLSIVTGVPPSVHGISGNFFRDPVTGSAIMMDRPDLVRCETIISAVESAGAKVAVVTAKDKLRRMFAKGIRDGVCFSAEKAGQCTLAEHGIEKVPDMLGLPVPDVYSAALSFFVLETGLALVNHHELDLLFLSLSDYVQHKYEPGSVVANAFFSEFDRLCGRFVDAGVTLALTADHGMRAKKNVVFLQDVLDIEFGKEKTLVICPITDPYVAHHSALGSFVRVYTFGENPVRVQEIISRVLGIEAVYSRRVACEKFSLPWDREADLVVLGDRDTAIGGSLAQHDLSSLGGVALRSHGGLGEQTVPFVISEKICENYASESAIEKLRNYDILDYALNGILNV